MSNDLDKIRNWQSVTSHGWQRDAEERKRIAVEDARAKKRRIIDTGYVDNIALGASRLGTYEDAKQLGMDDPNGVFLGGLEQKPIFMSGDVHLLTYGRTGSGKGRDVILPNLAHIKKNSVVVVDPKEGENAFATAEYRRKVLGHEVIFVNPWGLHGLPSTAINPLQLVINLAAHGQMCHVEAGNIAEAICPKSPNDKGEGWADGAQMIIRTAIEYLARFRPDECNLSTVWRVLFALPDDVEKFFGEIYEQGDEGLQGDAGTILGWMRSERQFEGYRGQMTNLGVYRPGSQIAEATNYNEYDLQGLSERPTTLYFMVPERMLSAAKPWISLIDRKSVV